MNFIGINDGHSQYSRVNLDTVQHYYKYIQEDGKYKHYQIKFYCVERSTQWAFDSKEELEEMFAKVEKITNLTRLDSQVSL